MHLVVRSIIVSALLVAVADMPAWSQARTPPMQQPGQPPPQSAYSDGTGDSAVDQLNAGQTNQHYTGPWYPVVRNPVPPGAPPQYGPPQYGPAQPGPPPGGGH